MRTYIALVHQEQDSALGITFPDLPGCFSAADTQDEIFEQAQLAIALYVSDDAELAAPRSISQLRKDPEIRKELADGAILIAVPVVKIDNKTRYNLMLSSGVVKGVDATARALGISRSEFVSEAVVSRLRDEVGTVFLKSGKVRRSARTGDWPATKTVKDPKASKAAKSVAASTLTQKVKPKTK